MFLRVRSASVGDPLHEFDVPDVEVTRHPGMYTVVDPAPVRVARPTVFKRGLVQLKAPARRRPVRRTKRPGEKTTAPAGADSLGGDHGE